MAADAIAAAANRQLLVHVFHQFCGHLLGHLVRGGGNGRGAQLQRLQQLGPLFDLDVAAHRRIALAFQQLRADCTAPEHRAALAMGAGTAGRFGLKGSWCRATATITPTLLLKDATAVDG